MLGYQRSIVATVGQVTQVWESPASIDNTGTVNVSAALTDWLTNTGSPGDIFKLRRGSGFAPGVYWIPQGMRIGKAMTFDLNGCWLFTGPASDPGLPALWDDWEEQSLAATRWPLHRVCVNVQATNVTIKSSAVNARIQGSGREVDFLAGQPHLARGITYVATLEMQHAIRLGGGSSSTPKVTDTTIDLTNIALEFVHGDGIYLSDGCTNITIVGTNQGEAVVGGVVDTLDNQNLRGDSGGLGGTVSGTQWIISDQVYPGIHHTGRHGIASDWTVIGLVIDGISIWRVARTVFDLETAGPGDFMADIQIINTESGIHRLGWVTAAAKGVSNLLVADNVCYEPIDVWTTGSASFRHTNWKLHRNQGGCVEGGTVFDTDRIDGLEIIDNFQQIKASADGINTATSTNVTISPAENLQFPVFGTGTGLGTGPLGTTPLGN